MRALTGGVFENRIALSSWVGNLTSRFIEAAWNALLLAHSGLVDRAREIIDRARTLNAHHPGWYHCVEFDCHYQTRRFDLAYQAIKRVNMPELSFPQLLLAEVCGQLGRADEARIALDAVFALEPAFADSRIFAEMQRRWFLSDDVAAPYREGFDKAMALARRVSG